MQSQPSQAFKALLTSVTSEEQPTALDELMYKVASDVERKKIGGESEKGHSGKTNVITAEKISVLTRGFWCIIPTTWGKGVYDYGSVRVGAFMGGKMIKSTSDISSQSYSNGIGNNFDELEEYGIEPLHDEASLD
ncbi:hypothetical protein Tco_0801463 [Tanacetum coccineum]|uniref:Uncharacterized protein n=1 Tax=Tanacetum coccineum TaxID=301880 RepID=A0ABQ5A010_9ASTR